MRLRQAADMPGEILIGTDETDQIGAVSSLRTDRGLFNASLQRVRINAEAIIAGFDRPCEAASIIEAQKLREKPIIVSGVPDEAARTIGAREELDNFRARFAPGDMGYPGPVRRNDDLGLAKKCNLAGDRQLTNRRTGSLSNSSLGMKLFSFSTRLSRASCLLT